MRAGILSRTAIAFLAWSVAFVMFFPIFWTVLTSFKTEGAAVSERGLLVFRPTLDSYAEVFARADYFDFALNSIVISVGATLLAIVFAVPSAYSMAFHPTKRTRGLLLWMLSTKMLPPVGVLMPIYVIFRALDLLDTRGGRDQVKF